MLRGGKVDLAQWRGRLTQTLDAAEQVGGDRGYVTSNLVPNESVVHVGRIHWFIFVPGVFDFVVALLFISAGSAAGYEGIVLGLVGFLFMVVAILSSLKAFIFKISTELAVTSKWVIAKPGMIRKNTIELNHSKVESYNVDQSIMGRIFGFGTVTVCGTGSGKTPVPSISDPLAFRRQTMSAVDGAASISTKLPVGAAW